MGQNEQYRHTLLHLHSSQHRLKNTLRSVCERLCDGLVRAECTVEEDAKERGGENENVAIIGKKYHNSHFFLLPFHRAKFFFDIHFPIFTLYFFLLTHADTIQNLKRIKKNMAIR